MPELPEVETIARTLAPHVLGCVFTGAKVLLPSSVHPLSLPLESLAGASISNARRRGKLLLLDLDNSSRKSDRGDSLPVFLVFHLRMTGRLLTREAGEAAAKHTRCIFGLRDTSGAERQLFFDDIRTFGKIMAATPEILESYPFWRNLGPEPLEMDSSLLAGRLKGKRQIKAALLDQTVIAGIGNIYADEALFEAGINPARSANSLSRAERANLHAALCDVLKRSIAQCGSSIRDYRDADGNAGAFQNSFAVYGRGGKKCKKCGASLQKTRIGGRTTVFCPECQK